MSNKLSALLKQALKQDPVQNALLKYYAKRAKKMSRDIVIGETHPSQFNGCGRALQFHWLSKFYGGRELPGMTLQEVFDNGTSFHRRFQRALLKAGVISRAEIPIRDEEHGIVGTMDGELLLPEPGVLELKSINDYGFKSLMGPKSEHRMQGITYCAATGYRFVLFCYENKNDQRKTWYPTRVEQKDVDSAQRTIEDANKKFHRKTFSVRIVGAAETAPSCKYCSYKEVCFDKSRMKQIVFPDTKLVGKRVMEV